MIILTSTVNIVDIPVSRNVYIDAVYYLLLVCKLVSIRAEQLIEILSKWPCAISKSQELEGLHVLHVHLYTYMLHL